MGERDRRNKIVVDREAQRRIVLSVCIPPAVALAMASMIIAIFCRKLVGETARIEVVLPSLVPLLIATLGFALVSVLIILNQAMRFSHRVVGPGYRLARAFEQVKQGDLKTRIKLRKGDHLVEVAHAFNDLLGWLERHPPVDESGGKESASGEMKPETEAVVSATVAAGSSTE